MSNPTYTLRPSETQPTDPLAELALNLRWSWNHSDDGLWGRLDPELWELTHNPWVVLQTVSQQKLDGALSDPQFQKTLEAVIQGKRAAEAFKTWFETAHPGAPLKSVGYFSMEYMLSEALPIYSGGLGNVAGDQLKAASDLGVPVTAVGLLYQEGYFRQEFDADGNQQAIYPFNDPGQLPIRPVRQAGGEWLRLCLELPGGHLWVRVWQARVGRALLYLLDSNDPANPAVHRGITSELYGGGPELRLKQEYLLGVGGWRVLRALGLTPEVCHLNEGHAAFAVLERARNYMTEHRQPFDVALHVTRAGNLFTTHTAVEAGFDRFAPDLMRKYLGSYAERELGIPFQKLMGLGRLHSGDENEPFNMAFLALHGSGAVNGVSRLHGQVSRKLFQPLFPGWPEDEVPVRHVTNGVHVPTWECPLADRLGVEASGENRWRGELEDLEQDLLRLNDEQIWQLRLHSSRNLVEYARKRLARQRAGQGASAEDVAAASQVLDPDTLTLGFARRFATYKRPNLLLRDPDRLVRLLTNRERPVQLILAGKAHPQDESGKALVKQWNDFIRRPDVHSRVVFLSDYDMMLSQQLVWGADVWINTPRRPWEASGTSGMKVLANGGINLSELDGWWAEAYTPDVGWAIGDGQEHGVDPAWDLKEAEALYTTLEREVIPEFYTRDEHGVPQKWVDRMRASLTRLTGPFSANRAVREYTDNHYVPAASRYCQRAADNGQAGVAFTKWRDVIATHWGGLRFGEVRVTTGTDGHTFDVHAYLDSMPTDDVRVELFANPIGDGEPFRQTMELRSPLTGSAGGFLYSGRVPANRPASDYTPRLVPDNRDALVPLEAPEILWQK